MCFTGLKSTSWWGWFLLETFRENPFFAISCFQRLPAFLGLWCHITLTMASFVVSVSLALTFLPPSFKTPCDYNWLSRIIQDNIPILSSLALSHLQSHFCVVRQYMFWFWGLGGRLLWWAIIHFSVIILLMKMALARHLQWLLFLSTSRLYLF